MRRMAAFSPGPSTSGTLRPSWVQLGHAGPSGLLERSGRTRLRARLELGAGRPEEGVCRLWWHLRFAGTWQAPCSDTALRWPAGRPAVKLQGPQTTSSAVPQRAGAQAGVLRSTKLPQQEKLPLASVLAHRPLEP